MDGNEVWRLAWREVELAFCFSASQGFSEANLSELRAVVEYGRADVLVDLRHVLELHAAGTHAVELGGLHDDAAVGCLLQDGQEEHHEVMLGKDIDLHMTVDTIFGFIVNTYAQTGVEDEGIELVKLGGKFLGDRVGVVEVFELDLNRLDFGDVAVLLQRFFRFLDVLFLLAEEVELFTVVLE